jgi:predicted DNA-binding protein
MNDAMVMVRLPNKLRRQLAAAAKKDGRPLSAYIRRVLELHVEGKR